MTDAEANKLVSDHAAALREHFDAVIILCSRDFPQDEKLTQIVQGGRGNWFAQRGMLREVLGNDDAKQLAYHLKDDDKK